MAVGKDVRLYGNLLSHDPFDRESAPVNLRLDALDYDAVMATQETLRFSVDNVYRAMLRRAATAGEKQFGALQLQSGAATQASLAIRLLSSKAFYQLAWRSVK